MHVDVVCVFVFMTRVTRRRAC